MYGGSNFNSIDARSIVTLKDKMGQSSLRLAKNYDPNLEEGDQKMTQVVKQELEDKKEKERLQAERELRENTVYPKGEEGPDEAGKAPKKSNWLEKIRQEQLERE